MKAMQQREFKSIEKERKTRKRLKNGRQFTTGNPHEKGIKVYINVKNFDSGKQIQ